MEGSGPTPPAAGVPPAEVHIDEALVRRQLARIDPRLASLPLSYLATGWDNVVYRLGDRLLVRAPRRRQAEILGAREGQWLQRLGRDTGLDVPLALHRGAPDRDYPFTLSVCRYLPGHSALQVPRSRRDGYARDLAGYLAALHVPAPRGAPRSDFRGLPLHQLDADTRRRLHRLADDQVPAALRIWDAALSAGEYRGVPRWLHGDPHPHNTVVRDGACGRVEFVGLVDFGDLCAGDPASDLGMAWLHFTPTGRELLLAANRAAVGSRRWLRARGWALRYSLVLAGLDPADALGQLGREMLRMVLDEAAQGGG